MSDPMHHLLSSLVVLSMIPAIFGLAGPSFPLTLLFQNSLNFTQNALLHPGLILASGHAPFTEAEAVCDSLSESLADFSSLSPGVKSDFQNLLNYQAHIGTFSSEQLLWVKQSESAICEAVKAKNLAVVQTSCAATLPVLCTQSAPYSNAAIRDTSLKFQISVNSLGRTFVGLISPVCVVCLSDSQFMYHRYRDFAAFRFLGIPFGKSVFMAISCPSFRFFTLVANPPARWEYSTVFSGSQKTFNATVPSVHCVQTGDSDVSEDCLFLNIFTPHIPAAGQTTKLKPVILWCVFTAPSDTKVYICVQDSWGSVHHWQRGR